MNSLDCIKCDRTFSSAKDLTNHLGMHAAMEVKEDVKKRDMHVAKDDKDVKKKDMYATKVDKEEMHQAKEKSADVEKSLESMKNLKMKVNLRNWNLPIERTTNKRKREGSGEGDLKRIKIQFGANEISVNCQVDKLVCKACKPNRNFKEAKVYRFHMAVNHGELDNASIPSTPNKIILGSSSANFTPGKSKVRVRSQDGSAEIIDMAEDSPVKAANTFSVINKLKSVSVNDVPGQIKSEILENDKFVKIEILDSEEVTVNNSNVGKFPKSLDQVRKSTKKRGRSSTSKVSGVVKLEQSESLASCVNIKFKEYVTADSESDFEVPEKGPEDSKPVEGEEMYNKVSEVIDNVLMQNGKQPSPTSSPKLSFLQNSSKNLTSPKALVKLVASYPNGSKSPVKSFEDVEKLECKSMKCSSSKNTSMSSEVVDKLNQSSDVLSCETVLDESPRSKSGRRLVKSKRLISTESIISQNADQSKVVEVLVNGLQKVGKEPSTSSTKSKVKSDSDNYNPETQSSDSATANSDAEFALPLRKSSRVRGPKPPQIRDPIENPAPKAKRRLSERKFEGAKPFKCNHCPLDFSNIESKKIHEQTHEEKPYQCVYCDMRFSVEFSLKKHTRIHKT